MPRTVLQTEKIKMERIKYDCTWRIKNIVYISHRRNISRLIVRGYLRSEDNARVERNTEFHEV